jgi:hypothetical protein
MPILYRKSAKGQHELETRTHRLPPRLRQVLILVDGRRTDDDLRGLGLPNCDEALHALAADGFIELVGITAMHVPARPVTERAAAAPAAGPAPTSVLRTSPGALPVAGAAVGDALRRDAVRMLTDQIGPMAEALAVKIERARTPEELRPLLEMACQSIRNTRGAFAATAFADRFLDGPAG